MFVVDEESLAKLAAYEEFASEVREELKDVSERMDALKAQGKVRTVTYQQLFAIRMTLQEIDARLQAHNL